MRNMMTFSLVFDANMGLHIWAWFPHYASSISLFAGGLQHALQA